ncbi:hypothetical protein CGRA01v4_04125 [Colletotrichum graminicola]|nr:hypothetical protein CGRA01v4_04125 [Colletotrichum graminicola]
MERAGKPRWSGSRVAPSPSSPVPPPLPYSIPHSSLGMPHFRRRRFPPPRYPPSAPPRSSSPENHHSPGPSPSLL